MAMEIQDSQELFQLMDDIEVETTEQYYYDDVSEFVERIELSTEEIILRQICPSAASWSARVLIW